MYLYIYIYIYRARKSESVCVCARGRERKRGYKVPVLQDTVGKRSLVGELTQQIQLMTKSRKDDHLFHFSLIDENNLPSTIPWVRISARNERKRTSRNIGGILPTTNVDVRSRLLFVEASPRFVKDAPCNWKIYEREQIYRKTWVAAMIPFINSYAVYVITASNSPINSVVITITACILIMIVVIVL